MSENETDASGVENSTVDPAGTDVAIPAVEGAETASATTVDPAGTATADGAAQGGDQDATEGAEKPSTTGDEPGDQPVEEVAAPVPTTRYVRVRREEAKFLKALLPGTAIPVSFREDETYIDIEIDGPGPDLYARVEDSWDEHFGERKIVSWSDKP